MFQKTNQYLSTPLRIAKSLVWLTVSPLAIAELADSPASSQMQEAAAATQRVEVRADRAMSWLLDKPPGRLESDRGSVSLFVISGSSLEASGQATLATVAAALPSLGENFAAVGYYENFTIRGFTLDMGSSFRVNGLIVPGEWHFPLEYAAQLEVLSGAAGTSGGLVGGGGVVNLVTRRGPQSLRAKIEADAHGGSLLVLDAGAESAGVAVRATASTARLRTEYPAAEGQRKFVGISSDISTLDGLRIYLDGALQSRTQPVVPGFQLLGGRTLPDLSVRGVNLNAMPWSRPVTNTGSLGMARIEGSGPASLRWEAAVSVARAKIEDNLATPFGCNGPPFEFFCTNGDYVLYDYHASEERTTSHGRLSAVKPVSAFGRLHLLGAGLERIDRRVVQRDVYYSTSYDADGQALSGNIFRPEFALPRPDGQGIDRPTTNRRQRALYLTHAIDAGRLGSTFGLRWVEADSSPGLPRESRVLPRLALAWRTAAGTQLFASLASGLEFGSEAPATASNAGDVLAPRVSRQLEAGLKSWADALQYTLTAFRAKRAWEFVEPAGSSWAGRGAFVQRGQQIHVGVEGSFEKRFGSGTSMDGKFTWITAEGNGSGLPERDGRQLQNVPRAGLNLRLQRPVQSAPGLSLTAAMTARSSKPATSDGSISVPGYAVFDAGFTWRLYRWGRPVAVDMNLRNLMDKRYWRDSGQAYSADLLFPGAARSVSIALQVGG